MAEEAVLSTVLSQVSRKILEKLERGKKLTTEDILLLYLDLLHREIRETRRELREEIRETNRRIDQLGRRVDELARRIDETNKRIDRVQEVLTAKIEEVNRRVDKLYELYAELRAGGTGGTPHG